jgi:uncharacterized protein YkwD
MAPLRALMFVLVALACTSCADMPTLGGVTDYVGVTNPLPDPATQMPALELRIFAMVQQQRAQIDPKAKPLQMDVELAGVARARSADMATKNYFAHTAPNGDTSATLLMAEDAKFQGLLGENIAALHYSPSTGVDVESFAQRFVASWMASKPHKDNLAFPDYDHSGVGAAVSGDIVVVTQLFSTDLGLGPHVDGTPPKITPMTDPKAAKASGDVGLRGPDDH